MDEQGNDPRHPDEQPETGGPREVPPRFDGRVRGVEPVEQRRKRRWFRRRTKRGLITAGAVAAALVVTIISVLWLRCGVNGCPDVDMLRGYMPDEASVVVDRNGEELSKLFVTRRVVVPVDSMPEHLLNAFVAIEDRRFWTHGGVDWRRVVGALLQNIRAGDIEEGSSTITMQLARNVFPDKLPAGERTLMRKIGEARVARQIEGRYGKREIIELYLNQIYFGSGAYGIESAAEEYFGKSTSQLTLAESALLAALPRAPSRLNPRANEEAALEGRDLVLRRMADQGFITAEERASAAEAELVLRAGRARSEDQAPYFVEAVRRQLEAQLGSALYTEGYTIHTTLDADAQRAAEEELVRQLRAMESGGFGGFPHRSYASVHADTSGQATDATAYLQGAVVIMEAHTGDIIALVGGRDYDDSQFNRATQAKRQPGSAFKPFVFAAAVSSGFSPTHRLMDQPLRYAMGHGRYWEPRNYDGAWAGVVTMRQALSQSRNVPTVRLANEVGLRRVLSVAEQFGLGRMPSNPSVVLGTAEVTPVELTAAYAAFATLGQRPEPRYVTRVVDRRGQVVWQQQPNVRRVFDPAAAFLTTSMLQDVVDRGTGTGVRAAGFSAPAAGKTGTTQDAADVWFVGFTPDYVATIWVGMDKRQRILRGATGGQIVAPVWGRIMRRVATSGAGWTPPSGVERHTVDEMGVVVSADCPQHGGTRTEYFIRGMAPSRTCYYPEAYVYGDSLDWDYDEFGDDRDDGWWDRLRRRFAREDSLRLAETPPPPTPMDLPGQVPDTAPGAQPGVPPEEPGDTAGPPAPPPDAPPLGRPVGPRPGQPRPAPRDTTAAGAGGGAGTAYAPAGTALPPGTGPGMR
jgi:1A family penicillin-binding protein